MTSNNWLHHSAASFPDSVFLETSDDSWTFTDMDTLAAQQAAALARSGVGPGQVVGLWADNSCDTVISMFAIPRAGAVIQLLNTRSSPVDLHSQLAEAGAVGVMGTQEDLGVPVIVPEPTKHEQRDVGDPNQVAVIAYTSGTSGHPKGVMLTNGNLHAAIEASSQHLRHQQSDSWLLVLPLFHVGGASILWRSAAAGSKVILHERFDATAMARDLHNVTLTSLVGTMLTPILEADAGPYVGLRAVLVGGGTTPPEQMEAAYQAGIPVLATYGMTETASQVATAPLGSRPRRKAQALPGVEMKIEGGELFLKGSMVARRYVGVNELGPEWLASGDIGEIDEDGMLTVSGRIRDIIISGGENISPRNVEEAILRLEGVDDAAVVGVADAQWGEAVAVAVVSGRDTKELTSAAREIMAGFQVPKRWLCVAEIPRNQMGKIDRSAVRALFGVSHG